MQRYQAVALDTSGNAISGVTVRVYLTGTTTDATIYSDNAYTVKANPFTSDSDGSYEFYAANGRYDVALTKTGYTFDTSQTYDVVLNDVATILSPAQITAQQDNYSPTNGLSARLWRLTSDAARTITGIAAGKSGQSLVLLNVGSYDLTLSNQSGSSTAANRIITGSGADITLASNQARELIYDDTDSRWRLVATTAASSSTASTQTFRGLHLRTHPDQDVTAYKVMLVHADEIVFDDGTRITSGLDRLVADITAAGAGGLDTGAEAASTWYEVYAIRKSSDATLNLLLHRHRDMTSEAAQQFTTADDASRALRVATSTATDKIAQGFQVGTAGKIDFVDVKLIRAGAVSGRIWFTIEGNSGSDPDGTAQATSDKLDASVVSTTAQWIRVPFRNPMTSATSTQYHLVMQGDYTRSDTVHISWRGVVAGGYANGSSREYNGTSWSATAGASGLDRNFYVYTRRNDSAVTMPSGYDQKCLVGYVYNGSGSDFLAFVARDHDVQQALVDATSTATVATLTSLATVIPTQPVALRMQAFSSVSADTAAVAGVPDGYAGGSATLRLGFGDLSSAAAQPGSTVTTEYQGIYILRTAGTGTITYRWVGYTW